MYDCTNDFSQFCPNIFKRCITWYSRVNVSVVLNTVFFFARMFLVYRYHAWLHHAMHHAIQMECEHVVPWACVLVELVKSITIRVVLSSNMPLTITVA